MINNLFIFIAALLMVMRGATLATTYADRLAAGFRLSRYTIGFIVVAVISVVPETLIAVNAALAGVPSFGLGMLFGSNIADLTLIFAVIILVAGRGLKIESAILKNHRAYPLLLLVPLALGMDGYFSRWEGIALIITGAVFYYTAFKKGALNTAAVPDRRGRYKNILLLLASMVLLLGGAHFTVTSATAIAGYLGVNPVLIGMLIVGLGTTTPELFFALKAVKKKDDSLAVGDIFGTVLADATIVIGILALIAPFEFPQKIIYLTGMFMVVASFVTLRFMRSGHALSKKEARLLLGFWLVFAFVEFIANTAF